MENLTKVCSKCKTDKSINEFGKQKTGKNGVRSYCKVCHNIANIDYRNNNTEKYKEQQSKYRTINKEKIKERKFNYRKNNKEKIRESAFVWRKDNQEKIKESRYDYYQNNKLKILDRIYNWRKSLPHTYIMSILKTQKFPQALIDSPEVIEVKRLIIQTKRLCKTSQI